MSQKYAVCFEEGWICWAENAERICNNCRYVMHYLKIKRQQDDYKATVFSGNCRLAGVLSLILMMNI